MHKEASEELRIRFKQVVLEIADQKGATRTCKEFNVPWATFYRWKKRYAQEGRSGLVRKKPILYNHPRKT